MLKHNHARFLPLHSKPREKPLWEIVDEAGHCHDNHSHLWDLAAVIHKDKAQSLQPPSHQVKGARVGQWVITIHYGKTKQACHEHITQNHLNMKKF